MYLFFIIVFVSGYIGGNERDKEDSLFNGISNFADYFMPKPNLESNSSGIFIIQDFRTIVFLFIIIFITFQPICPPAFFRLQVLSIHVLLLVCYQN